MKKIKKITIIFLFIFILLVYFAPRLIIIAVEVFTAKDFYKYNEIEIDKKYIGDLSK